MDFAVLPPEVNSARIFAGAGSGPLFIAAAAWDGLAADLQASASSFASVIAALTSGPWAGPASLSMVAAASPYVGWLDTAAGRAELSAGQARAAATAFEAALTATVHPAVVTANRVSLTSLIATNLLGQNAPAIAATEFDYVEMWAQDVAAMVGYHAGATSAAAALAPFTSPPISLSGLASQIASQVAGSASAAASKAPGLVSGLHAAVSALPVQSLMSVAQIGMYPASMMISPMMSLAQSAHGGTAGLADAAMGLAGVPKFVGDPAPALKGLGGGAGAVTSAGLGQARTIGAMSVPPTWAGSLPARMASAVLSGFNASPTATVQTAVAAGSAGMPMMPMPTGMGAAGAGMPGAMTGRGGAGSHVVQSRPSVIPRAGVG
ncbi:PPE family protein [Mycobacterium angelicum]|uniref:PPE family protein n=1 Tax=Mycobacterium angelicum TaxID=470074 RepID=A0A1W9ZDE9_MYCAN|nr:PPE family protein [Mycobacterium angelicum]MCV7198053.1 PPE family protein [Mycobacterium angelicum]ORA12699.1 hypothetical protein BST12_24670 [Mycobacterium angelicum]